jgi:carboxyl-terminal processing protease
MLRKQFSAITVFILLFFGVILGSQIHALSDDNIYEQLNKFKDVLSFAQKYYVDEVNPKTLVEAAIEGMLKSLDPHSVYIPPKQLEKVQEDFRGKFEGVGIEFSILRDTINVSATIFGGPSEKVGILAGDKIVKIDNETAVKFQNSDVQKKLRGKKGTKVVVEIVRAGATEPLTFTITRDEIPLVTVDTYYMIDDVTAYMSINRFAQTTHQEFVDGLHSLRSKGMKQLILDLRGNPGGYLDQAFRMANEFLKAGQKIVYTKGRKSEFDEDFVADGSGEFQDLPLIVLISNGSASASEIVAGAVQDHDRGLIVGLTSFGKGLVQRQFDLADGSAFRLTTARYYTPSGRLIQRPYKPGENEEDYYKQAYLRDEETSDNVEHGKESADTTRPHFKTDAGRTVLGGGGITPDYIIKFGRLTDYGALMRSKVFEFVINYMDRKGPELRKTYGKEDVVRFMNTFKVDESLIQSFIDFGTAAKIKFDKKQFDADDEYLRSWIKSQIARTLFGSEGYFRAANEIDIQFKKARTLFPEARKIAGLK